MRMVPWSSILRRSTGKQTLASLTALRTALRILMNADNTPHVLVQGVQVI